ncbi:MAG: beta-ketoacyl-[acyl-carrier-protein] synthase family protein [Burkholderiaceae bacterium]|nr:beta-ketoacyl-[acyl-carrier-protein] synthase family protein [Burkholderiaceae bacterium]
MPRLPIVVSDFTVTTAVGHGREALRAALRAGRGALKPCVFAPPELAPFGGVHRLETWIGEVEGLSTVALPPALARFDCRNNRLAYLALQQDDFPARIERLKARYGRERVAVILGTSTSGLLHAEWAYHARPPDGPLPAGFDYAATLNAYSLADFVTAATGLAGPAYVISTACSSSAKVFASAARLMQAGLADAALVGGVDSLCLTTLYGFGALELLARTPCKPFAPDRSGISIGEGAGFAILERAQEAEGAVARLAGWGESSDAHHMSSPHPEGLGAQLAMRAALARAGLAPDDIDYINLHGTATRANDIAEGLAVAAIFGDRVPTSSTKAYFGHLLGAAGIAEAAVTLLALADGLAPGTLNTVQKDPACPNWLLLDHRQQPIAYALTNSFGFGGSNCSLIFGQPA